MISFENFIMEDGSPIYLQIVRHIERGIVAGTIRNQDEMRRESQHGSDASRMGRKG